MSVAAQIVIRQRGNFPPPVQGREKEVERTVWLYRASDGQPQLMASIFDRAFTDAITPVVRGYDNFGKPIVVEVADFASQADYAASFLCSAAPGVIVPRHDHILYSWVRYVYFVDVTNPLGSEINLWTITEYHPGKGYSRNPSMQKLAKIHCELQLKEFYQIQKTYH